MLLLAHPWAALSIDKDDFSFHVHYRSTVHSTSTNLWTAQMKIVLFCNVFRLCCTSLDYSPRLKLINARSTFKLGFNPLARLRVMQLWVLRSCYRIPMFLKKHEGPFSWAGSVSYQIMSSVRDVPPWYICTCAANINSMRWDDGNNSTSNGCNAELYIKGNSFFFFFFMWYSDYC